MRSIDFVFAKKYRSRAEEQWKRVLSSDESTFCLSAGNKWLKPWHTWRQIGLAFSVTDGLGVIFF